MINTAKFILLILFPLVSINTTGQSILVKGGLSLSNITGNNEVMSFDDFYKIKSGVHLGISYEQEISDIVFLEIGSMLSMKGAIIDFGNSATAIKFNTVYIDVPILIKEYLEINDAISIYGGVGPYFGFGLVGSLKDDDGNKVDDVIWGESESTIRRFDFGLSVGAGIDFKGIQLGLVYDWGLFNISSNEGDRIRNNVFRITAGYRLAGS